MVVQEKDVSLRGGSWRNVGMLFLCVGWRRPRFHSGLSVVAVSETAHFAPSPISLSLSIVAVQRLLVYISSPEFEATAFVEQSQQKS